jgi:hypothetical protein
MIQHSYVSLLTGLKRDRGESGLLGLPGFQETMTALVLLFVIQCASCGLLYWKLRKAENKLEQLEKQYEENRETIPLKYR